MYLCFVCCKQKTAYEMRISDWSSDVCSSDLDDLADITLARKVMETAALKRAFERGGDDWEAGILAAYHRLERFGQRMDNAPVENLGEFGELHKAFHVALIAACGSPRLLDEQARLYDQAERYRHRMLTAYQIGRATV